VITKKLECFHVLDCSTQGTQAVNSFTVFKPATRHIERFLHFSTGEFLYKQRPANSLIVRPLNTVWSTSGLSDLSYLLCFSEIAFPFFKIFRGKQFDWSR